MEIKNEINHTYAVFECDPAMIRSDFRYRMLRENKLQGLLPMDIRNIDGAYKMYVDISDKESIFHYCESHLMSQDDIKLLLEDMMKLSKELELLFCEESGIVTEPELIFLNRLTGRYEFIYFPSETKETDEKMTRFIQYIMDHMALDNMNAVEAIFEIYDMSVSGVVGIKTLYEKYITMKDNPDKEVSILEEPLKDEEESPRIKKSIVTKQKKKWYQVTLKEVTASVSVAIGVICMCAYIYLGWL